MVNPKSKSEKLSETSKSVLDEIFIKENYGREKIIVSKYLEKGNNQESESISLYRKHNQIFASKNEEKLENSYLVGTPDIRLDDKIVDVKTCWDIWTFHSVNATKAKRDYFYQLVGYMILDKKVKAELAYCLVSNSEADMYSELRKIQYMKGLADNDSELLAFEEQIRLNNTYDAIPLENRIKVFEFELSMEEEDKVYERLAHCKDYLNTLTL